MESTLSADQAQIRTNWSSTMIKPGGAKQTHQFNAAAHVELGKDVMHVYLDRAVRNPHCAGDLLIAQALGGELRHLPLPPAQTAEQRRGRSCTIPVEYLTDIGIDPAPVVRVLPVVGKV